MQIKRLFQCTHKRPNMSLIRGEGECQKGNLYPSWPRSGVMEIHNLPEVLFIDFRIGLISLSSWSWGTYFMESSHQGEFRCIKGVGIGPIFMEKVWDGFPPLVVTWKRVALCSLVYTCTEADHVSCGRGGLLSIGKGEVKGLGQLRGGSRGGGWVSPDRWTLDSTQGLISLRAMSVQNVFHSWAALPQQLSIKFAW